MSICSACPGLRTSAQQRAHPGRAGGLGVRQMQQHQLELHGLEGIAERVPQAKSSQSVSDHGQSLTLGAEHPEPSVSRSQATTTSNWCPCRNSCIASALLVATVSDWRAPILATQCCSIARSLSTSSVLTNFFLGDSGNWICSTIRKILGLGCPCGPIPAEYRTAASGNISEYVAPRRHSEHPAGA